MTGNRRKDAPEEPPKAIECPECGCGHFEVIRVEHRPKKIVRRRQCRNCGRRIRTVERIEGEPGHER